MPNLGSTLQGRNAQTRRVFKKRQSGNSKMPSLSSFPCMIFVAAF
jgi:hypothetical protein